MNRIDPRDFGNLYIIGIDLGTTSVKGVLLDGIGRLLVTSVREYELTYGPGNTCELDVEVYWEIMCSVVEEILKKSAVNPLQVSGISFSSQGETLIVVDKDCQPLRKALVWLDNRSGKEAKLIEERFGIPKILSVTGQSEVIPTWPATRILWIRENEPEIFKTTHKFLLLEDYMLSRMTGHFFTEHSISSSTLYFDIVRKEWWKEMLNFLKITENQLPDLLPSGVVVGNLTETAASQMGLSGVTKVVTGAYDHPAGAIGAGNIVPGIVTMTIGASMAMCVTLDEPVFDSSLKLPCQCHAVPGLYFLLPYTQTAGLVLKWFKDEFCREEIQQVKLSDKDPYFILDQLAARIPPGAEGLIALPHFMGTGSPEFNSNVKGVFAGITPNMKKGHFIRAILESVVCSIELNLQKMKQNGIKINRIHALGGGAKSHLWNQILADMSGLTVITTVETDNAAIGAAILAGTGTGLFSNLEEGCKLCIKENNKFTPDPVNKDMYGEIFDKYRHLYDSLADYW